MMTELQEDELNRKGKAPLVKLDFSAAEGERAKHRLEEIRTSVPTDMETLFKAEVRWDGLSDVSEHDPDVSPVMTVYVST